MKLSAFFKSGLIAALLSVSNLNGIVIDNAGIISDNVRTKLNQIGSELKEKTGVTLDLITTKDSDLRSATKEHESNLKKPYILLAISPKTEDKKSGKVDIFASDDAYALFDKDAVLSPYPEVGTILPILVSNKGKDIYNAAMLNGYADISDMVAKSKNVILVNSIGNSNKTTLNLLRYFVYGSIFLVIVVFLVRKFKRGLHA